MFQHSLISIFLLFIIGLINTTYAQSEDTFSAIPSPNGFNGNADEPHQHEQSWIQKNHNYVIIIVIVLVLLGIILYYIVRSVKGMRKRLARENEQQLQMLNQMQQPYNPQPSHPPPMMDGYKYDQYHHQQQQPPAHNYRY
ncbi:unnamed protein product [Cunninghamella echinulata]